MMPAVGAYCDDPPTFSITPADTTYKAVGANVAYEGECSGAGAHDLWISITGGLSGVNTNEDGNEITLTGTADTTGSYTVSGGCTEHDCSAEVTLKISDVTGLTVSGATLINGKYYVAKGDDAPEITATIAGDIPADFVNWSGATQDPEDQTRATRSTATAGECTVEGWLDGQPNDHEDSAKESVTIVVFEFKVDSELPGTDYDTNIPLNSDSDGSAAHADAQAKVIVDIPSDCQVCLTITSGYGTTVEMDDWPLNHTQTFTGPKTGANALHLKGLDEGTYELVLSTNSTDIAEAEGTVFSFQFDGIGGSKDWSNDRSGGESFAYRNEDEYWARTHTYNSNAGSGTLLKAAGYQTSEQYNTIGISTSPANAYGGKVRVTIDFKNLLSDCKADVYGQAGANASVNATVGIPGVCSVGATISQDLTPGGGTAVIGGAFNVIEPDGGILKDIDNENVEKEVNPAKENTTMGFSSTEWHPNQTDFAVAKEFTVDLVCGSEYKFHTAQCAGAKFVGESNLYKATAVVESNPQATFDTNSGFRPVP